MNPVQTAAVSPPLSILETAVLEAVVYSDVFDYPLTPAEIWHWLPIEATLTQVEEVLENGRLVPDVLSKVPPYVTLQEREHLAGIRERRQTSSATLRGTAEGYSRLISRLPFVRMVALTGSLAVQNAERDSDIDYLIVTGPGRVWLTRAMTMIVVRIAAVQGVTLCPNYLLSEAALALPERNLYTARELLQMVPAGPTSAYAKMMAENVWCHDQLPNAPMPFLTEKIEPVSTIRRVAESLLGTKPFDWLEAWLLSHKGAELRRQAGSEAAFDQTKCKGHFEAWGERTRGMIEERLQRLVGASQ